MTEKTKTYFVSDFHLGAGYITNRREHEDRIVEMLEAFGEDAKHIYLLGDILDYWFEYKTVVPRGYIRFFGCLARLVDRGIKITWLIGNHDIWLFDYLRNEIGIEIIDGSLLREIDGKHFYLAHGDALGKKLKPSFRFIRAVFRNRVCQKLYSGIHPRWTVAFAHNWSSGSRKKNDNRYPAWRGDEVEPSVDFALNYLQNVDPEINYFIMGHRHVAHEIALSPTCHFVLLGECYKQFSYAVWDGKILLLNNFVAKRK